MFLRRLMIAAAVTGLMMYSFTPMSRASWTLERSEWPDNMMIGKKGFRLSGDWRIICVSWMPSTGVMLKSVINISGIHSRIILSASAPLKQYSMSTNPMAVKMPIIIKLIF